MEDDGQALRERAWSPSRMIHEMQNGLPYRTIPEGYVIDWHDPRVESLLNVKASEIEIFVAGRWKTVWIEVLPPTVATTVAPAPSALPPQPATCGPRKRSPRARRSREIARLLEVESEQAVKTGQISRALKASYLENELALGYLAPRVAEAHLCFRHMLSAVVPFAKTHGGFAMDTNQHDDGYARLAATCWSAPTRSARFSSLSACPRALTPTTSSAAAIGRSETPPAPVAS